MWEFVRLNLETKPIPFLICLLTTNLNINLARGIIKTKAMKRRRELDSISCSWFGTYYATQYGKILINYWLTLLHSLIHIQTPACLRMERSMRLFPLTDSDLSRLEMGLKIQYIVKCQGYKFNSSSYFCFSYINSLWLLLCELN